MAFDLEEFRSYLKVNKNRLDDELVQQPSLLFEVSEELLRAIDARDALKNDLMVIEAEEDTRIRKAADQAEEKVTEGAVKAKVATSKKRQAAYATYMDQKAVADQLSALKEAFIARGYAIRDLCQLTVANYFQSNSIRGDAATDAVMYHRTRTKLAAARDERTAKRK